VAFAGQFTQSGTIKAFAVGDNIVIQWTPKEGWTTTALDLFIGCDPPTSLVPGQMTFRFSSTTPLKFVEILAPFPECSEIKCDDSYFIALHMDTHADDSVVCGRDPAGNGEDCHGDQSSWLIGPEHIGTHPSGFWFLEADFCCCFDSSLLYSDTLFFNIHFSAGILPREFDIGRDFVNALILLFNYPVRIVVLEVHQLPDGKFSIVIAITSTQSYTAGTISNVLTQSSPDEFKKVGLLDVTVEKADADKRPEYTRLLASENANTETQSDANVLSFSLLGVLVYLVFLVV